MEILREAPGLQSPASSYINLTCLSLPERKVNWTPTLWEGK